MKHGKLSRLHFFSCYLTLSFFHNVQATWKITSLENPDLTAKWIVTEARQDYRAWLRSKMEYPQVLDLNKYISDSKHERCFVAIDNFAEVNLSPVTNPLMLRVLHPAVVLKPFLAFGLGVPRLTWSKNFITNVTSTAAITEGEARQDCNVSDYSRLSLCTAVNFLKLTGQVKTWMCQIHMLLFPPYLMMINQISYIERYSSFVFKEDMEDSSKYTLPMPTVAPAHVLVKGHWESSTGFVNFIQRWIKQTINNPPGTISHDKFYVITVSYINELSRLRHFARNAVTVKLERITFSSIRGRTILLFPLSKHSFEEDRITTEMFEVTIFVNPDDRQGFTSEQILRRLISCDILPEGKPFFFNRTNRSAQDFLSLVYANVLFSAMKNYTIMGDLGSNYHSCINGAKSMSAPLEDFRIEMASVNFITSFILTPYLCTDKINNLRFVTCGQRGMSSLAFFELTGVFDNATWTLLIACILAVAMSLCNYSNRNSDRIGHIIATVKVFLEQGDTILETPWDNQRLRVIVGTTLLMGIVISNSYKNTNVYRMIVALAPLRFETLEQLVDHNFSLYSRFSTAPSCSFCKSCSGSGSLLQTEGITVCARTEIDTRMDQTMKLIQNASVIPIVSQTSGKIRNATQIHPEVERTIAKMQAHMFSGPVVVDKKKELQHLYESLKSCQGVALILPYHLCTAMYKNLVQEKIHDGSLGKEIYLNINFYFPLKGPMSPRSIKRIKGISMSGIWDFLVRLVSDIPTEHYNVPSPPKPVSIHGNVIVIFSLWISGGVISLTWFIFEIRGSLLRVLDKSVTSTKNKMKMQRYDSCRLIVSN